MKKILIRGLSVVVLICSVVSTEGMKETNNIETNVGINLSQNDDNLLRNNSDSREQQRENDLREFRQCSQNDDNLFDFLSEACDTNDFYRELTPFLVDKASKIVSSEETLDRAIGLLKSRTGKEEKLITCMVDLLKLRKLYKKNEVSISTFFKFLSDACKGSYVGYCAPEIIEELKSKGEQDNFYVKRAIVLRDLYEYVFRSDVSGNNLSEEVKNTLYRYLKIIYWNGCHPVKFLLPDSYLGAPKFCIPPELAIDWIQKNVENSAIDDGDCTKEEIIDLLKLRIVAGSDDDFFDFLLGLYCYRVSDRHKEWVLSCLPYVITRELESGLETIKNRSYDSNERVFVCIDKVRRLLKLVEDFNGKAGELFPLLFISDEGAHNRRKQLVADLKRNSDLIIEERK